MKKEKVLEALKDVIGSSYDPKYEEDIKRLARTIVDVAEWRLTAKDPKLKEEADIAWNILTEEIPITMRAIVIEEQVADRIGQAVNLGLKVAKALIV